MNHARQLYKIFGWGFISSFTWYILIHFCMKGWFVVWISRNTWGPEIFLNNEIFKSLYFSKQFQTRLVLKVVDKDDIIYFWGLVESNKTKLLVPFTCFQDGGEFCLSYGNYVGQFIATDHVPMGPWSQLHAGQWKWKPSCQTWTWLNLILRFTTENSPGPSCASTEPPWHTCSKVPKT